MIAIQTLIDEKFVMVENGSRNSLNLKSVKEYRESEDQSAGISSFEFSDVNHA